jgi:hypothetical protein
MLNEGNQIHNFISSSGTVINYGSGSDFLMSYGLVPAPVPQGKKLRPYGSGSGSTTLLHTPSYPSLLGHAVRQALLHPVYR